MLPRSPKVKRRLMAFFAVGLAGIFIFTAGFSAGAVPMDVDPLTDTSISQNTTTDPATADVGTTTTPGLADDVEATMGAEVSEEGTQETDALLAGLDAAVGGLALMQAATELTLSWEVKEGANLVGGATVELDGPYVNNQWGSINTTVTDCTSGDCANTLDKDPTPGKFSITQRSDGAGGYKAFELGQQYRIKGMTAPAGYSWQSSTLWEEMGPGVWAQGETEYKFDNPLQLNASPAITWEVKNGESHVGGSVFKIEGPRQGNSNNWNNLAMVEDCVVGEGQACPAISVDQDPRPGYFKVHTMRWGTSTGFQTHAIQRNIQYRVTAHDAPVGFAWSQPAPKITQNWPTTGAFNLETYGLTAAATLAWTVEDEGAMPVGGATFEVRGPGTTGPFYVTDCTLAPCHPESMDQDPAPGKFKIDALRGLHTDGYTQTVTSVSLANDYTIKPMGSIPNYSWVNTTTVKIQGNRSGLRHEVDPPFQVTAGRVASQLCTASENVNSFYSLFSSGSDVAVRKMTHDDKGVTTLKGELLKSPGTLVHSGQKADALGVTPTGVFYFTGQNTVSNAAARNTTIYRFDPSADSVPYPIFNMDLLSPTTGAVVSGDATIYKGREEYYFAYYSNSSVADNLRFHLYRYSHGRGDRTGEVYHIDVPRPPNFTGAMDGDFVFDSQNNLQFIISGKDDSHSNQYITGVVDADRFLKYRSVHTLAEVGTIQGSGQFGTTPGGRPINGVAFTQQGRAIIQQYHNNNRAWHSIGTMPDLGAPEPQQMDDTHLTDLASCSNPPTVSIQTELVGERYNPDDQFTLAASREAQEFSGVTTTGSSSGIQQEQIGPYVLTLEGQLNASFKVEPATDSDKYSTSWACYEETASGRQLLADGPGTELTLSLTDAGSNIACIFTTVTIKASLEVIKTVDPASGTAVNQNDPLRYTVTFNNAAGTAPAELAHVDHLVDVLDDAVFTDPETPGTPRIQMENPQGLVTQWQVETQQIIISGTIPAGSTVSFTYGVTVLSNSTARTAGNRDFYLQSFVTKQGEGRPDTCVDNAPCTTNPINAWTVEHASRPADGARLHSGGNAHYQLVARKITEQTRIENLVFTDDLTNVFKTAGFAPDAVVPAGALKRGIYFFDKDGYTLNLVTSADVFASRNNQNDINTPVAAYGESAVPVPTQQDGRWILTSAPVIMPLNAIRAELWFAVEAGNPKEVPGSWETDARGNSKTPKTGDRFTNYVMATASNLAPTRCVTGSYTEGVDFPDTCQVTHELQDNYFTIRKDAQGPGVDAVNLSPDKKTVTDSGYGTDTTGMWNMIGHKFEIRDHDPSINGPTSYPSRLLCRTDYNPRNANNWDATQGTWIDEAQPAWNGEFLTDGTALAGSSRFDWEEASETAAAIQSWNNAHPDQQLPNCALIYEQGDINNLEASTAGGQTGRWRSEHLPTGEYWLVETQAPTHQISTDGKLKREVPGIQLLAQPIPFKVWPDEAHPDTSKAPANRGLGQLDVSATGTFSESDWLNRCEAGAVANARPTACVNPTGYLLLVKDVTSITLPFSGGRLLTSFTAVGAMLMALAGLGIFWWRRRE